MTHIGRHVGVCPVRQRHRLRNHRENEAAKVEQRRLGVVGDLGKEDMEDMALGTQPLKGPYTQLHLPGSKRSIFLALYFEPHVDRRERPKIMSLKCQPPTQGVHQVRVLGPPSLVPFLTGPPATSPKRALPVGSLCSPGPVPVFAGTREWADSHQRRGQQRQRSSQMW